MQGSNSYQLPISTIRTSYFYLDTKPADHSIFQWKDSILQKIPKVWSLRHKKILWNEDTLFPLRIYFHSVAFWCDHSPALKGKAIDGGGRRQKKSTS